MQQNLTITQLNQIAHENYLILSRYCSILMEEGYWDEPSKILRKPINQILDYYIQSCLIQVAVECSETLNSAQLYLIATLTKSNPYDVSETKELSSDVIAASRQFMTSPPILLQLVGMRDTKQDKTLGGLFFDAILNILIVMAYLSNAATVVYMKCLQTYCEKTAFFIQNARNQATIVDDKYLFKKISTQDFGQCSEALRIAGEDFTKYKEEIMYYPEAKPREEIQAQQLNEEAPKKLTMREPAGVKELIERTKDESEQVVNEVLEQKNECKLDELLRQLNELVGLNEVKQEINSLINLIKVKKLRERYCLPGMDMSYHMVFSGNPGTGKTTVARLVAQIYCELGLLSKGTLVETDRSGLVAGYVGQTAIKVKEVVQKAIGGVLFIDEAYSLTIHAVANDFGTEAIDTLVKMMEDHREDLVVIVAGYTKEMKEFLKSNTGLVSRFNRFIEFKDYTQAELVEILESMAKSSGFTISEEAIQKVMHYLSSMPEEKRQSFGNARGIRNLFERMVVVQANRIVSYEAPTVEQLTRIEKEDIEYS